MEVLHSEDHGAALGEPFDHRTHRDDDARLKRAGLKGARTGRAEVDAEQMGQRRMVLLGRRAGQAAERGAQLVRAIGWGSAAPTPSALRSTSVSGA